jgi:hypothetical protein
MFRCETDTPFSFTLNNSIWYKVRALYSHSRIRQSKVRGQHNLYANRSQKCESPAGRRCNPTHSGGRDQEDLGWKPAQANSSRDPISKKPITKKGLVEWLKV